MTVLVTGADGFVGRYLVRRLLADGHRVVAAVGPDAPPFAAWLSPSETGAVTRRTFDLRDREATAALATAEADAVVHLAALASGGKARADPEGAWLLNTLGTVYLLEALGRARTEERDPTVLVVSTGEVYGPGAPRPRVETDPINPVSSYAASKAAAELAARDTWRRTGLRVILVRPFAHTGPGQTEDYMAPAFAARLREAQPSTAAAVPTGNLAPVRDLLDVRDVVDAYVALLQRGTPGDTYNVASGTGVSVGEVFRRLAGLLGCAAEPVPDPGLARASDVPHLVGDATKLRAVTGWAPRFTLDQTLSALLHAETH